jgi:hypothetical protein
MPAPALWPAANAASTTVTTVTAVSAAGLGAFLGCAAGASAAPVGQAAAPTTGNQPVTPTPASAVCSCCPRCLGLKSKMVSAAAPAPSQVAAAPAPWDSQPASAAPTAAPVAIPANGLAGFLGFPDATGAAAALAPAGQAAAPAYYYYGSQPASAAPTSASTTVPAAMPAVAELGGLLGSTDAAGAAPVAAPAGQAPAPACGSSQPASPAPTAKGSGEMFDVSVTQDAAFATCWCVCDLLAQRTCSL